MGCNRVNIDFQTTQSFCLFIGYPRSGTSLLGALLDAHPNMVISHELHVLRYFREKSPSRDDLFSKICRTSLLQAAQGRTQSGYSYRIADSLQGQFEEIRVIGDKKAQGTSDELLRDPELLARFRHFVGLPIKFVHIVRNPFDTISTVVRRSLIPGKSFWSQAVRPEKAIDLYFDRWNAGVLQTRRVVAAEDWHTIHLESLVEEPQKEVGAVCDFLGVHRHDTHLQQCSDLIWESPKTTRGKMWWTQKKKSLVLERMREVDFLAHYEF
jgi:hypothetical protein